MTIMTKRATAPMAARASKAIPVHGEPSMTAFTIPWQCVRGRHGHTVVLKLTYDLVVGQPLQLRTAADPPSGDISLEDQRHKSLLYPTDFAIRKDRCDVLLTASAFPARHNATSGYVRFSFGARGGDRFDRRIAVFGEREWLDGSMTSPAPFEQIPLVYERALGGEANPIGIRPDSGLLPNIEDPDALLVLAGDNPAPVACCGVSASWPARSSLLGSYDEKWRRTRFPYFPDDFDWAYFQAAPKQQQLAMIHPRSRFVLAGVHPEHPVIDGSLPNVDMRCFVQRRGRRQGSFGELSMRLDTVVFDVPAMKVNLVWRGRLDVADVDASDVVELYACRQLADDPRDIEQAYAAYQTERALRTATSMLTDVPANGPSGAGAPSQPVARRSVDGDVGRRRVMAAIASGASLDGVDLCGARLSGLDLSGCSLRGALLDAADLSHCRLAASDLRGAQLGGADLSFVEATGVMLTGADLTAAKLVGAVMDSCELSDAVLVEMVATDASFRGATGEGPDFGEADCTGACFDGCELSDASFIASTLTNASFCDAQLADVRLYDAQAAEARFDRADMHGARADGVLLQGASLLCVNARDSVWDKADLERASFAGADLQGGGFVEATGQYVVFDGCDMRDTRLSGARLRNATFETANLMQASCERADLSRANLRGANLYKANLFDAELQGADTADALVAGTELEAKWH